MGKGGRESKGGEGERRVGEKKESEERREGGGGREKREWGGRERQR